MLRTARERLRRSCAAGDRQAVKSNIFNTGKTDLIMHCGSRDCNFNDPTKVPYGDIEDEKEKVQP